MEVRMNSCLPHPEAVQMERGDTANRLLDSRKLSQTWTVFSENTIRELAACGNIPVVDWVSGEPIFVYDNETARAFLRLFRGPYAR